MAGIFTIKPHGQSDVVCTLGESTTVNYFVVQESIVLNEAQRYQVAYANGDMDGEVSGARSGLVPIQFDVWVFGSTMEDRLANVRTLSRAIMNEDGGYVQYRPRGLGSSILSTYYHYLSSAPPQIDNHIRLSDAAPSIAQAGRTANSSAILCRCQVMTKAWATSDPTTPVSIVTVTAVDNVDDANQNNYIIVDSALIKGDVLFPILRISDHTGGGLDRFIIHKRKMRTASNDRLDYIEAETHVVGGSTVNNAAYSGGVAVSLTSDGTLYYAMPAIDSTYHGHIVPMVVASVGISDTWTIEAKIVAKSDAIADNYVPVVDCGTMEQPVGSGFLLWHKFDEFQYPISDVPFFITDTSTPSVKDWACSGLYLRLIIEEVGSAVDPIIVDFIYLAKTDEYLSEIALGSFKYLEYGDIIISSLDDVAYQENGVGEYHSPVSQSVPATGLAMMSGYDHRLTFFALGTNTSPGIDQADQVDVTITGIYGTIYPFNES